MRRGNAATVAADAPDHRRHSPAGAWCGLVLAAAWVPLAAVLPLFPDLDSRAEVIVFWQDHGLLTLRVMAVVLVGYPFYWCSWPTSPLAPPRVI